MTESTLTMFVWAIFAAILAAALYSFAVQRVLSGFISRLIKAEADAPEKAETLKQLGYTGLVLPFLVRTFVKGGSPLARAVVVCTPPAPDLNNTELLFPEKAELSYYLPEENRTRSFEKHYKERLPLAQTAAIVLLLLATAFAATGVIRFFGNWTNALIDGDSKKHAYGVNERDDSLLDEQEKLNADEEKRRAEEAAAAAEADKTDESDESDETDTEGKNTALPDNAEASEAGETTGDDEICGYPRIQ